MSFAVFLVKHSVDYIWEELSVDEYLKSQKTQSTFIQDNYCRSEKCADYVPGTERGISYLFSLNQWKQRMHRKRLGAEPMQIIYRSLQKLLKTI